MTKVTHQEHPPKPKNDGFPKLMRNKITGTIGLFKDRANFTCLVQRGNTPFAHQERKGGGWTDPTDWEPFYGSVTITSEP